MLNLAVSKSAKEMHVQDLPLMLLHHHLHKRDIKMCCQSGGPDRERKK